MAPTETFGQEKDDFLPGALHFSRVEFTDEFMKQIEHFQLSRIEAFHYFDDTDEFMRRQKIEQIAHKIDMIMSSMGQSNPTIMAHHLNRWVRQAIAVAGSNKTRQEHAKNTYRRLYTELYKNIMISHRRFIMKSALLTAQERAAVGMIGIEPHVILIFDDPGETLKTWPALSNLYIRQHRLNIAIIMLVHNFRRISRPLISHVIFLPV